MTTISNLSKSVQRTDPRSDGAPRGGEAERSTGERLRDQSTELDRLRSGPSTTDLLSGDGTTSRAASGAGADALGTGADGRPAGVDRR